MDKVVAFRLPDLPGGSSRKSPAHLHPKIAVAASRNSVEPGCSLSWRKDPLSAQSKALFFQQVSWRIANPQDCDISRNGGAVCAGNRGAAHMPQRTWVTNDSPPNQVDMDKLSASLLAVLEERSNAEASASNSGFEATSAPAASNRLGRQPAEQAVDPWSFQAEDFEWGDRRDPITSFSCFGESLSTSYSRIWSLREKHGVWFAADQERHPKPVWSLDDPDCDGDLKEMESGSPEAAKTEEVPGPSDQADSGDVWLLDSSFLVALLDSHDLYSPLCLLTLDLMGNAKKAVSPECIGEATQLIRSRIGGLRGVEVELFLYECIERGTFEVVYPETIRGLNRFIRLKDELMDSGLGPAAAAIMALSKQLPITKVATLDRKNLEAAGARCNASIIFLPTRIH